MMARQRNRVPWVTTIWGCSCCSAKPARLGLVLSASLWIRTSTSSSLAEHATHYTPPWVARFSMSYVAGEVESALSFGKLACCTAVFPQRIWGGILKCDPVRLVAQLRQIANERLEPCWIAAVRGQHAPRAGVEHGGVLG